RGGDGGRRDRSDLHPAERAFVRGGSRAAEEAPVVSLLGLVAIVEAAPGKLPGGLQVVAAAGVQVVVAPADAPPTLDEAALRAHDAAVRHLCELTSAVLPMRFGETAVDATALDDALAPHAPALRS